MAINICHVLRVRHYGTAAQDVHGACVIRPRGVGKGANVCDNWQHDRCCTKKQAMVGPTMLSPLPSKAQEVCMSLPVAMQDKAAETPAAEAASALRLDARQRAMLQEMGVRLWLPPSASAAEAGAVADIETGVGAMAAVTPAKADAATAIQRTPAPQATKQAVQQQALAPTGQKQQPPTNKASALPVQHAAVPQAAMMLSGQPLPAAWAADAPSRWLFVLDALAADGAASPLQGEAGKLLLNMAAAIRLRPQQGCCVQAPHCVPRPGQAMDAAALRQSIAWLQREIVRVQPQVVVALGRHAACSLLGSTVPLGQLRGQAHRVAVPEGEHEMQAALAHIPVVVSYPLAYLLRTPAAKRQTWQDLCLAHALLEAAPRAAV